MKSRNTRHIFEPNKYPLNSGLRLIEASAGTGKTFALAHIFLRLITEREPSPKQILVVTFTEVAAAEIKARITNRIELALKGLEADNDEIANDSFDNILEDWVLEKGRHAINRDRFSSLLLTAQEQIDQADITTIHGFCMRTLQREALATGTSMRPKLEEGNRTLILEVVNDYWQDQILELEPYHLKAIQATGFSIRSLTNALLKIDNDPYLEYPNSIDQIDSSKSLSIQLHEFVKDSWCEFISLWERDGALLEDALRSMSEKMREDGIKDTKPFSPKPTKNRHQLINMWLKAYKDKPLNTTPNYLEIRSQALFGNYFHPSLISAMERRNKTKNHYPLKFELQKAIASIWDGPAELVWDHALKWTTNLIQERRDKSGLMNYGDLLKSLDPSPRSSNNKTNKAENKEILFERLRCRYKAIMIDEFQDTDPIQWRIINQTFRNSPDHLLLMVGDPKQAIYQFRGGNLQTYIQAKNKVDRIDNLTDNFRTTAPLLNSLNRLYSHGLKRSELSCPPLNPCTDEKPLIIKRRQEALQVLTLEPNHTNTTNEDQISKSKLEEKIPIIVANAVLELLKEHPNELNPADICILVGRHDQAESIRKGLTKVHLPSRLVSQGDIFKSEAAQYLQRFLDCLVNPANSVCLRLVACSALLQWTRKEIEEAETNGEFDQLAAKFQYWAKHLPKLGILGCLSELLIGQNLADLSQRGRMLGDLQQCGQLLQEAVHLNGFDVKSAAKWLRQKRLEPLDPIPENYQPNSDIEESAVNVLTVHRSKGLEFRVVICPYLWQAPPPPKGPLWRNEPQESWLMATNTGWGKGKEQAEKAKEVSLQESERLAYVALTRARSHLIVIWAKGAQQEGNPLTCLLFGPETIDSNHNELSTELMHQWLTTNEVAITIKPANQSNTSEQWSPPKLDSNLSLAPTPQRLLDQSWGRSSYSAWINKNLQNDYRHSLNPINLEEGRDTDEQSQDLQRKARKQSPEELSKSPKIHKIWEANGPLAQFPCGASAGNCLHKILERLDFDKPLSDPPVLKVIEEELLRAGINLNELNSVQKGIDQVMNIPLGGALKKFKLNQLKTGRRIPELKFDLPIAHNGKALQSIDVANVFKNNPQARFGETYSEQLINLNIYSRGFLTGSIDLVFTDCENISRARWWVADWKSNWIGERDSEGKAINCGPMHYDIESMENLMMIHHYPLQAHIYLVALHRFLQWRLPNYSPQEHLGGYVYIFLRGVPSKEEIDAHSIEHTIPGLIVEEAPLERIERLDQLLKRGGK